MMRFRKTSVAVFLSVMMLGSGAAAASDQVTVAQVRAETVTPNRYKVIGIVNNYSPEDRELILRAQIAFYRQDAMEGERPEWILRKDMTRILRSGDSELLEVELIDDAGPPKGIFRKVPMLRIRRDREWKY